MVVSYLEPARALLSALLGELARALLFFFFSTIPFFGAFTLPPLPHELPIPGLQGQPLQPLGQASVDVEINIALKSTELANKAFIHLFFIINSFIKNRLCKLFIITRTAKNGEDVIDNLLPERQIGECGATDAHDVNRYIG